MIGQNKNKSIINTWTLDTMPRCIIISGSRGCGKRTTAEYIAEALNMDIRWVGNKVGDVRDLLSDCRSLSNPTLYVFVGADEMSLSAKNSLLKVTEEPPNNVYFIIPLEDISNTLPTIQSRSIHIRMEPYTKDELRQFGATDDCLQYATTPGEVTELLEIGVDNLVEYVDKVIDNICSVSTGNALKIVDKIKIKDDDEGYPITLFLRIFSTQLSEYIVDHISQMSLREIGAYQKWSCITQECLNSLSSRSLNKKFLLDKWILDIRKVGELGGYR